MDGADCSCRSHAGMSKRGYHEFEQLSDDDRRGIFIAAAQELGILPSNAEKDYWVCRVLGVIIKKRPGDIGMIFKGGTSLSKAYKIIKRFSEDVDLVLNRQDLIEGRGDDIVDTNSSLS